VAGLDLDRSPLLNPKLKNNEAFDGDVEKEVLIKGYWW